MPQSEFTLRRRVQFYELDSAGIVHFSTYFRYMEEAEHALWREAGLSVAPSESEVGFPRVAASFEYHRPLRFEEEFEVHIRVEALGEKSIRFGAVLTRGETTIATGRLTVVCVRKRPNEPMKAIAIPPESAEKFEVAADRRS